MPEAYKPYYADLRLPASLRAPGLALLAERLGSFLNRPLLSHEDGAGANREGCPLEIVNEVANPDMQREHMDFWVATGPEEIAKRRAELVSYLAEHVEKGEKMLGSKEGVTRGIVMTGGNGDTGQRVVALIKHLHRIGNTLPIEVVHYPDELTDKGQRKAIEDLGARLIQVKGIEKIPGAWKNYQIKATAMIQCSFTEFVYLDSDNMPLAPLKHLFNTALYTENGRAAFWPDIGKEHADNAVWRVVGDTCSLKEWTFESGQIVLDKRGNGGLNLAALWLAAGMLLHHDFWFKLCGGDKDTFRWAFRILDIPYTPAPRWLSALGFLNEYEDNRFCGQ